MSETAQECWACGAQTFDGVAMLAEVAEVSPAPLWAGAGIVDRVYDRVTVCLPCSVEARRRALLPLHAGRHAGRPAPARERKD